MNFVEFQEVMKPYPIFSVQEIRKYFPGFDTRRLVEWQKKGYLQKLRNRYYCFRQSEINEQQLYSIGNRIYGPSYISLQSALAYYGFIPERVFRIISCTTLKTQTFTNEMGQFIYRHLKPALFFGYRLDSIKDVQFAIAEPEKALIDYCYLNSNLKQRVDFAALRWNRSAIMERINLNRLAAYEGHISSSTLSKRLKLLRAYLHVES